MVDSVKLQEKINYANSVVSRFLPEESGLQSTVLKACNYSVLAGGKRVRSILMRETWLLLRKNLAKDLQNAYDELILEHFMAAIEMIHTYSLVHDDLPAMDNDDYRRGRLTTHKKFGEAMGILAGDALLNYAFETVFAACELCTGNDLLKRAVRAGGVLSKKAGIYGMIGGQTVDVEKTGVALNQEELDFIFKLKTGALIEASMMCGAILAGADDETINKIEEAALHIGIAFQIQDDILDVTSTTEVLGKPVMSDEKNNKTTYVSLFGLDKAQNDVKLYSDKAVEILKCIGENQFLTDYVRYLINREK